MSHSTTFRRFAIGALFLSFVAVSGGCREASAQDASRTRSPEVACYELVQGQSTLSETKSKRLCRSAPSAGPAQCYLGADDRLTILDTQAVALCRCARGTAPVACFERADSDTDLRDVEIVERCSARRVRKLRTNCVPFD